MEAKDKLRDLMNEPVLIDLDRWMHIEASAFEAKKYGKSVMYSIPREIINRYDCTVRNLDWLQVGLLICSLLDEREKFRKDYHADLPVLNGGTFLYSLVSLGEYVPDQHKTWDPSLFTSLEFTRQL